jgi:hypothetical protein
MNPPATTHTFLELTKALAWPITAGIALVAFWGPLHETANAIPSIIQRSDTISVSGVKLTIRKGSIESATPQARAAVDKLDGDDIRLILETTMGTIYYNHWGEDKDEQADRKATLARWKKFIGLGLAHNVPKAELEKAAREANTEYDYGVTTTDTFSKVRETLIGVTAQIVTDAKTVAKAE